MTKKTKYLITLVMIIVILILLLLVARDLRTLYRGIRISEYSKLALNQESPNLEKKKLICILAMDSGGVRGVVSAYALDYIAKQTKLPIAKLFDLLTGSSTGSIAAAVLSYPDTNGNPKYTTKDLIDIYNQNAQLLFKTSFYYKIITLGGFLGPKFSPQDRQLIYERYLKNLTIHHLLSHVFFPTYDLNKEEPLFFRSWEQNAGNADFYLKDVLAGATSPLGFFPPVIIESVDHKVEHTIVDAAIYSSNPSMLALLEAERLFPNQRYLLVSIGTGKLDAIQTPEFKNIETWGLAQWAHDLSLIASEAQKSSVDMMLRFTAKMSNLNAPQDTPNLIYYRIDVPINRNQRSITDSSILNMDMLNKYGEELVKQNKDSLDKISQLLLQCNQNP